tara:strand:+ start:40 stop:309 length:270 start_codon:yes stop_codon:yes gene_type:complete
MKAIDEEESLRQQFLEAMPPASISDEDEAIDDVLLQANRQTGTRDMIVLAVSSFFSFLQLLMAPLVAHIATHNINQSKATIESKTDSES